MLTTFILAYKGQFLFWYESLPYSIHKWPQKVLFCLVVFLYLQDKTTYSSIIPHLASSYPNKVHEIETMGYQLMKTKFTLLTMDFPAGVVCQINHLYPLQFPDDTELITKQLLQILEAVYRSRLIIERIRLITLDKIMAFSLGDGGPIPSCF